MLLEFPVTCAPHLNAHFLPHLLLSSTTDQMVNEQDIQEALADLRTQEKPNFTDTAKKYNIVRSTLTRRFNGETTSMEECISMHRQALSRSQENALLDLINRLTDRNLPPTPRIVKNLAEEIRGCAVGKNWTASFIERHKAVLKSAYLRTIDNIRVKGEYTPAYELFYKQVKCYFALLFLVLEEEAR